MPYHSKTGFYFLKPTKVQSRTKFLNGVICGLSDRSGSEEAERSHSSETTKLSRATGAKRQKLTEPQERSEKVQQSAIARATPGWTASKL